MSKVQVGGTSFTIILEDSIRDVSLEDGASLRLGEIRYKEKEIAIYNSPDDGEFNISIYHELTHAIVNAHHIRSIREKDGSHDEDSVDRFAMGLQEALSSLGINIRHFIKEELK